ncbi:hypothetical protein C8Q79DRAFT_928103 [Trametes meyenii]|nr:hypothetical protein C8Q79DRAFT_928103 [Trametes meyenii]
MHPPTLPVEIIEHAIGFFYHGDGDSRSPNAPFAPSVREASARTPCSSLELFGVVIQVVPALETFALVRCEASNECPGSAWSSFDSSLCAPGRRRRCRRRRALRALSVIEGGTPPADLARLVAFLERQCEVVTLRSLNFEILVWSFGGDDQGPGPAPHPGVPSFGGPALHEFGVTVWDTTREGQHMERVLADLPRCGELRAPCVCYDCNLATAASIYRDARSGGFPAGVPSPFFLNALADVLDGGSRPLARGRALPFLFLERLDVVVFAPPAQLEAWREAFARLARALLATGGHADGEGDRGAQRTRRYPRFARLRVETRCLEIVSVFWGDACAKEERARQEADGKELVRPMLEDSARAGVEVEVVVR